MADAVTTRLPHGTPYQNMFGFLSSVNRGSGLAPSSCIRSYLRPHSLIRGGTCEFTCERHSSLFLIPELRMLVHASLRCINDFQRSRDLLPERKNKKMQRSSNAAMKDKVWGIRPTEALKVDHVYTAPAKEAWIKGPFDFSWFLSKLQTILETYPSSLSPRRAAAFAEECRDLLDDLSQGHFEKTFPEKVLRSQSHKLQRFFDTTSGLKDVPAGIWEFCNVLDQKRESVTFTVLNLWGQVAELRSLTPPYPTSRAYTEQVFNLAIAQNLVDVGLRTLDCARKRGDWCVSFQVFNLMSIHG